MGESMIKDLGMACLVFWSIIGVLLSWYVWKIRIFNLGHNISHKLEEEGHETEPLLLENLRESEHHDFQDEASAMANLEDPTHS